MDQKLKPVQGENGEQMLTTSDRDGLLDFNPVELEKATAKVENEAPDPFDVESLRLTGDFNATLGVKKILTTVPVRKPDKSWFVRTHPSEDYRLQTAVIELKDEREVYLVSPQLWPELAGESCFSPRILITSINRQGALFLWQIRLPSDTGRQDHWSRSALEAAALARDKWTRVQADMHIGAYSVFVAENLEEPAWPEEPFQELLRIAFRDQFINSLDHPILKRLRGEI